MEHRYVFRLSTGCDCARDIAVFETMGAVDFVHSDMCVPHRHDTVRPGAGGLVTGSLKIGPKHLPTELLSRRVGDSG